MKNKERILMTKKKSKTEENLIVFWNTNNSFVKKT